jgi:NAD(P)-dependent dehydrogenase (short-subunit alcohol dehydrogenase family)
MKKDIFDLTGRVALVTGASRGIGESIARLLAANGATVIVSSRKIDGCETVAQSIRDDGGDAVAMACHVGEMVQIEHIFEQINEKYGRLDILVNNAAANPYFGHILDTDLAAFNKTVDVNIRGYFFMSTAAGKMMKLQGGGVILNTASINGMF